MSACNYLSESQKCKLVGCLVQWLLIFEIVNLSNRTFTNLPDIAITSLSIASPTPSKVLPPANASRCCTVKPSSASSWSYNKKICTMKPPKIKDIFHGIYLINPWYIHGWLWYHGLDVGAVPPNSLYKTFSWNRLWEIIIHHVMAFYFTSYSMYSA